ncbi:hypothetical protein HKX48_007506 [Thoreauomyces humboldtii]|nr:hypothetical protein HKX48_007506 [Thoreauomyces humboldtii]
MSTSSTIGNVLSLVLSALLVLLYHLYLRHRINTTPSSTVYGLARATRRIWVAAIMLRHNEILAVQTLRNWVMAASFLASTAILVVTAVLALVAQIAVRWTPETVQSPVFGLVELITDDWFPTRIGVLVVCFCAAFACFAQSVRFFNHAALVCNVNITPEELETITNDNIHKQHHQRPSSRVGSPTHRVPSPSTSPKNPFADVTSTTTTGTETNSQTSTTTSTSMKRSKPCRPDASRACYKYLHNNPSRVACILNRGAFYYSAGMRCYYVAFPLIAWLWGPVPLAVASVVLVSGLRVIDFGLTDFEREEEASGISDDDDEEEEGMVGSMARSGPSMIEIRTQV